MLKGREILKKEYKNSRIWIWGTNKGSMDVFSSLTFRLLTIDGFVDNEDSKFIGSSILGKKIIGLSKLKNASDILIVTSIHLSKESEKALSGYNYCKVNEILEEDSFYDVFCPYGYTFQILNNSADKKIYIYNKNKLYADWTKKVLDNCLEEQFNRNKLNIYYTFENVEDLIVEGVNIDDSVFIINDENIHTRYKIIETLRKLGGSESSFGNICSFMEYRFSENGNLNHYPDCLLGISDYGDSPLRKFPGWIVYGNPTDADMRIIVLGGSTSTEGKFTQTSWVHKFYRKLKAKNNRVVIFNGAHFDQTVTQELLRLLRDFRQLKPNLVISMSGVNDMEETKLGTNQFYVKEHVEWLRSMSVPDEDIKSGIQFEEEEPRLNYYCYIQKVMKAVCECFGCKHIAFLQPMRFYDELELKDRLIFINEGKPYYKDYAGTHDTNLFVDLKKLFKDRNDCFKDTCHYSERGEELLAEEVMKYVMLS